MLRARRRSTSIAESRRQRMCKIFALTNCRRDDLEGPRASMFKEYIRHLGIQKPPVATPAPKPVHKRDDLVPQEKQQMNRAEKAKYSTTVQLLTKNQQRKLPANNSRKPGQLRPDAPAHNQKQGPQAPKHHRPGSKTSRSTSHS